MPDARRVRCRRILNDRRGTKKVHANLIVNSTHGRTGLAHRMAALVSYTLIGATVGLASVGATRAIYAVEDAFARLPIHWMWWPAIGGLVVGIVGYILPKTMGVGYEPISCFHSLESICESPG